MKPDGHHYFEYVLLHTDNCLVISPRGESVLQDQIGKFFELKAKRSEESIGAPDIYLGGKLRKVKLASGNKAWAFGSSQYVQVSVDNVEKYLIAGRLLGVLGVGSIWYSVECILPIL
jgi:hypothetical protein